MKVNLSAVLKDPLNREIRETQDAPPLTLGAVCTNAFLNVVPEDEKLPMDQKMRVFQMACKLAQSNGEIELTVEEVSEIKSRLGAAYYPIVFGAAVTLLEGGSGV